MTEVRTTNSPCFDRYAIITMLLQAKCSEVLMGLKEHLSDHHGVTHRTCSDTTATGLAATGTGGNMRHQNIDPKGILDNQEAECQVIFLSLSNTPCPK